MTVLDVKNFAQIESAHIEFGALTVLVGPQATGKSLLLQWLKVALDAREVVHALKEAGRDVKSATNLVDLIFGEGMSGAWTEDKTVVTLDGKPVTPRRSRTMSALPNIWRPSRKLYQPFGAYW